MGRGRILIVDDDESIRRILNGFLKFRGFETEQAPGAQQAIERMNAARFDIVITDVRMPGMSGIDLLRRIRDESRDIGVVVLTGCDDVKLAVQAMQMGALDYVVKPFHMEEVERTLEKACERLREERMRSRHIRDLEMALQARTVELRRTLTNLHRASESTLEALVSALDAREHETQAHSKRVSEYAVHLARGMGVGGDELEDIRRGSMLHDIGKIGISDTILLKPGGLTEGEWVEMRRHPQIGYWIVDGVEGLRGASDIVLSHHERFDGLGYPSQARAENIPLGARIFAVVDSMDAITSDRPYRRGADYESARQEIARNAGSQFDPVVAGKFLEAAPEVWKGIRDRALRESSRGPAPEQIQAMQMVFT